MNSQGAKKELTIDTSYDDQDEKPKMNWRLHRIHEKRRSTKKLLEENEELLEPPRPSM